MSLFNKDFERFNANQWETESNMSFASSAHPQGRSLNNLQQKASRSQVLPTSSASTFRNTSPPTFQASTTRGTPTPAQVTPPYQQGHNAVSASTYHNVRDPAQSNEPTATPSVYYLSQGQPWQRHKNAYTRGSQRQFYGPPISQPIRVRTKSTGWAEPPKLVTTRMGILNSQQALKDAEMQNYRSQPDTGEEFPITGYYLWPKGYGDPMSLLDPMLKTFDILRSTYKVHIDWNDKMNCLRINGKGQGCEGNVMAAIEGIKLLYLDARAQVVLESPLYIIVPPTADAMRSIVRPNTTEDRENVINPVVTSIGLAGDRLSAAEKLEWESTRRQMNEENSKAFRNHLVKRILKLANLRGWMRMRVQFGHINLSQYQNNFKLAKYSFDMFAEMMKKSRVATGGSFDRKMDGAIAMNLIQRIVDRGQDFCPRKSKTPTLGDVLTDPKHTEIIFVTTSGSAGQTLRLEADIESVHSGAVGKYQIGHTRLFENDRRNKRVEITTVDIESKFDWSLEIIQDGEIKCIPKTLQSFIAASLDSRSTELLDPVGLPYPAIALSAPKNFTVQSVVMRSVFQYQWISTSNTVEIAIYREWKGFNTRPAPVIQASVSMFNPDWDAEMDSIEHTTQERKWDRQLHNFFGKDGVSHKNTGLSGLMTEVREVQRLLSDAATDCTPILEKASIA